MLVGSHGQPHVYSTAFCKDGTLLEADKEGLFCFSFPYMNDYFQNCHSDQQPARGEVLSVCCCDKYCTTIVSDEKRDSWNHVQSWPFNGNLSTPAITPDQEEKLFEFAFSDSRVPAVASYANRVVVTSDKSIMIYNRQTKHLSKKDLLYQPLFCAFTKNEGHLLMSTSNSLIKYEISANGHRQLLWTYKSLPDAAGVCTTTAGVIIVQSFKENKLFLVPNDGEQVNYTYERL